MASMMVCSRFKSPFTFNKINQFSIPKNGVTKSFSFSKQFTTQQQTSTPQIDYESLYSPYKKPYYEQHIKDFDLHIENDDFTQAERSLKQIHFAGFNAPSSCYTKLIYKLCQNGELDRAKLMLLRCLDSGLELNVGMFNALIRGYFLRDYLDEAMSMVELLFKHKVPPNSRTFDLFIEMSLSLNRITLSLQFLRYIINAGNKPSAQVYDSLIKALYRNALNIYANDFECFKNGIKEDAVTFQLPSQTDPDYADSHDHIQAIIDVKTMMKENSGLFMNIPIEEAATLLHQTGYFTVQRLLIEDSFRKTRQNSSVTKYYFDGDGEEVAGEPLFVPDVMIGKFGGESDSPLIGFAVNSLNAKELPDADFYGVNLQSLQDIEEKEDR